MSQKTPHRQKMDEAIKTYVLPELRKRGFRGSLPHLRRIRIDRIDVLSFQHFLAGGSFCVNIGSAGSEHLANFVKLYNVPKERITTGCCPERRLMHLGPDDRITDEFVYGPRLFEPNRPTMTDDFFKEICRQLLVLFENQADEWWANPDMLLSKYFLYEDRNRYILKP